MSLQSKPPQLSTILGPNRVSTYLWFRKKINLDSNHITPYHTCKVVFDFISQHGNSWHKTSHLSTGSFQPDTYQGPIGQMRELEFNSNQRYAQT